MAVGRLFYRFIQTSITFMLVFQGIRIVIAQLYIPNSPVNRTNGSPHKRATRCTTFVPGILN